MGYKKYSYLIATSIVLSGCQTASNVVQNYDEFQKRKVCKLQPKSIRYEFGMASLRNTDISLELQSDGMIKAILDTKVIVKIMATYDNLNSKSKIKFIMTSPDNRAEELIFQGHDLSITHGSEYIHPFTYPTTNSLLIFNLSQAELRKIINAQEVEFFIEAGKEPITGSLKESHKEGFKDFLKTCASSSEVKK